MAGAICGSTAFSSISLAATKSSEKEEVIYIVDGSGKTYINGYIYNVCKGTAVLFPKKSIHMLRNTGKVDMKVVCFFTPQATLADYEFHEQVVFPE